MRGCHKGFTLFELLLYVALTIFLVPLLFSFCITIEKAHAHQIIFRQQTIRTHVVLDLLKRDIMGASCNPNDWFPSENTFKRCFLDQNGNPRDQWISWQVTKRGLSRSHREIDPRTKKWRTKHVDLFGNYIAWLQLIPKIHATFPCIEGVIIRYQRNQVHSAPAMVHEEYVHLRNRVVV